MFHTILKTFFIKILSSPIPIKSAKTHFVDKMLIKIDKKQGKRKAKWKDVYERPRDVLF